MTFEDPQYAANDNKEDLMPIADCQKLVNDLEARLERQMKVLESQQNIITEQDAMIALLEMKVAILEGKGGKGGF